MNLFGLGPAEILVVLFLILLFFGKDRLPEMTRSIGRSLQELKNGFSEGLSDKPDSKKKS